MNKTTQRRSCPRGGRMALESVAGCPWNGWPNVHGIGGRITVESVAECGRNTQAAQFEDVLVTGFGFFNGFFADLGDLGGSKVAGVEQVVDVGEAEPELAHEGAAVFVVALAKVGQNWAGGLPEAFGEREGIEAF